MANKNVIAKNLRRPKEAERDEAIPCKIKPPKGLRRIELPSVVAICLAMTEFPLFSSFLIATRGTCVALNLLQQYVLPLAALPVILFLTLTLT